MMVKKRVAELEGAKLDWAVAMADGNALLSHIEHGVAWQHLTDLRTASVREVPRYSTDWDDGGPIIERERIEIQLHASSDGWWAGIRQPLSQNKSGGTIATGPTLLIAAMRAFVASKLGDEVEVPA